MHSIYLPTEGKDYMTISLLTVALDKQLSFNLLIYLLYNISTV